MHRLAVFALVLGIVALGAVLGFRFLGLASGPPALAAPPGEGRLDQPTDVFAGLFRSWSLGGQETNNAAQEEAILRLGTARGSKLIGLELRRRELERMIADAQADLEKVRASQSAAVDDVFENGAEEPYTDDLSGEDAYVENAEPAAAEEAYATDAAITPEEAEARDNLAVLEEEYQSILADLAPSVLAREKERAAEIAVLSGGAARGVQTLLARWGQPFRMVEAGAGLAALVKSQLVLIVPSGALEKKIGGQIAAFTRAGGTVIAFAQRSGAELHALPGGPRGFGWTETESAFDGAVEVAAAHPAAASCRETRFSAAIDGFFTGTPAGAVVLLRAVGSGRPVAVSYPCGKGRVVATTLYADWVTITQPPGAAENLFLRDLTLWAVAAAGRLRPGLAAPGGKVEVALPIVNDTQEMAKKVRVCYLTPEGASGKPFELDLRILPKEREDKTVHLHAPKTPGVWHLVYALVRADGSLLQYWRNAVDLAVGVPAAAPEPRGLGANVTCPAEVLRVGNDLTLTVNLWNYGHAPAAVRCVGPTGTVATTVPGGGDRKLVFRIPAAKTAARGYYEFELAGPAGPIRLAKLITVTPSGGKGGNQ